MPQQPASSTSPKPVVLIVRDGWGRNPNASHDKFNAVKLGHTPVANKLLTQYPWTLISTSGEDVGLPDGTMGNSEVGHQNLGAGRVVYQESVRISRAVRLGEFYSNVPLVNAVDAAKKAGKTVHLMGLASDAGVHALLDHLYGCLELCKRRGATKVAVHLFTDGRDTGPFLGKGFIETVEAKLKEVGIGSIVTVAGRYYAMDRDNRWERVQLSYAAMTGLNAANNSGVTFATTAAEAAQAYYDKPTNDSQKGDEFIPPTMIGKSAADAQKTRIADGDTILFYNYRGDRPREIIRAFMLSDEEWAKVTPSPDSGRRGFERGKRLALKMVTMTAYEEGLPVDVAYPRPPKMTDISGEYLSKLGKTQFRSAETEKFPHVTFFFNDYREQPFPGESRGMAQSPKVATYDLQPEMSAAEVCRIVLERINAPDCEDFILVNFANGDMVGHTGKLDAAIKAVETVDACVGKIVDATLARGGSLIVTADHGNCEQMWDPENNCPHTAHTTYLVECIVVDPRKASLASGNAADQSKALREKARLADVLPTVLDLMGLAKPGAMEGRSLFDLAPDAAK